MINNLFQDIIRNSAKHFNRLENRIKVLEIRMNRVEKYRYIRHFRIKMIITFMSFILTLFTGIFVVDYSMSSLLSDEQRLLIFSVCPYGEEYYKISIFDKNLYINTKYLSRDYNRLLRWIDSKSSSVIPGD